MEVAHLVLRKTLFLSLIACLATLAASANESGFRPLFDGKTLNGWRTVDARGAAWEATEGMIVCPTNCGGKLMTEEEFDNFVLRIEYRIQAGGNNGVNIRAPFEGRPAYAGMEIQILDDESGEWRSRTRPEQRTGSIYGVLPARSGFALPTGEWNELEITARDREISVRLNKVIVLDGNLDIIREKDILDKHPGLLRPKGHIGLLGHGTRTEFRNLRVKPLR
ncbi:MAG: DUF1080 domain-containing protein [Acidobacteriota bacterium]